MAGSAPPAHRAGGGGTPVPLSPSAHPIVSPAPIRRVKSSASGAMVTEVFHAPLSDAISEEVETRGASSGHSSAPPRTQHHAAREYAPSLRESFICLSPPGPVTIPRYAPFPVRGSVYLSRYSSRS